MSSTQKNACISCRRRKLKCDRQQPCANCVGRSVQCKQQLLPPPAATRGAKRALDDPDTSTISGILFRLDRIEAYINQTTGTDSATSISEPIATEVNIGRGGMGPQFFSSEAMSGVPSKNTQHELDYLRFSANDDFLRHALTHHLSISISMDDQGLQNHPPHSVLVPHIEEAFRLSRVYHEYVGQFQHIIFEPHFRIMTKEIYHHISHVSNTTAPPGLALLLAVIAMAIILQPLHGNLEVATPILKERLKVCAMYIRSSMDCLEQHRRKMDHTLESVQAMLVLQFLINHIEGFSPRFRTLMNESIAISHSLGLHRVDAAINMRAAFRPETDEVTREMKRRVWWYLTAMDWMTSMAQGPYEAVYLIRPEHISTNIPRHINDDDLGNLGAEEVPVSQPTSMSYNLQRLKVAEISRYMTDVVPQDPSDATFEIINLLDSKVDSLVRSFPTFFKVELAHTDEVRDIDQDYSYIPVQRMILSVMVDMLRCKLHFPYLAGHQSKDLHDFSRKISVKAAHRLLATHRDMATTNLKHSADFMKVQGTVFHMFVGALVMAIDLCCNLPQGEERAFQLSELTTALGQLDRIKKHSQIAARFLEALNQLMVKHGIWSPNEIVPTAPNKEMTESNLELRIDDRADLQAIDNCAFDELWAMFVKQPSAMDLIDLS